MSKFSDYLEFLFHTILPKRALTKLAGLLANVKKPAVKNYLISYFIRQYHVNMEEALIENPENYEHFNAFFIRRLKPDCRPIALSRVISPVDGYISEWGTIEAGSLLQAKGRYYSIHELLACEDKLSSQFNSGLFTTLYLSPSDYHRIHMPIDATLKEMIYVPGALFSVQPATTRVIPKLFARNERLVVFFDTPVGLMAMVLVGATIVGAIGTAWHGELSRSNRQRHFVYPKDGTTNTALQKAAEMGYFKLGSTVILLFAESQGLHWAKDLVAGGKIHFGDPLIESSQ